MSIVFSREIILLAFPTIDEIPDVIIAEFHCYLIISENKLK